MKCVFDNDEEANKWSFSENNKEQKNIRSLMTTINMKPKNLEYHHKSEDKYFHKPIDS